MFFAIRIQELYEQNAFEGLKKDNRSQQKRKVVIIVALNGENISRDGKHIFWKTFWLLFDRQSLMVNNKNRLWGTHFLSTVLILELTFIDVYNFSISFARIEKQHIHMVDTPCIFRNIESIIAYLDSVVDDSTKDKFTEQIFNILRNC